MSQWIHLTGSEAWEDVGKLEVGQTKVKVTGAVRVAQIKIWRI